MEIIMNIEQNHPQQPILKQSFRVPQLLYVKIKDRINMTWFYFAISFMKEVSWFTGLSLSNNINEMYLPKAATA
jgi:hypothetical protein